MMAEVAVTVKDDDRTYTQKFMDYEFIVPENHQKFVKQTVEEFQGEVDEVKLIIRMEL